MGLNFRKPYLGMFGITWRMFAIYMFVSVSITLYFLEGTMSNVYAFLQFGSFVSDAGIFFSSVLTTLSKELWFRSCMVVIMFGYSAIRR